MNNTYSSTNGVQTDSKFAAMKIDSFKPRYRSRSHDNDTGLEARILYLGTAAGTRVCQQTGLRLKTSMPLTFRAGLLITLDSVTDVINALKNVDVLPTKVCDLPKHEGECLYPPVHYQFADAQG